MAKSNRDLTIALIAKADQFDLAEPARDLEKLGDAAKKTGDELDDLDKGAKSLDKLGDAAKGAGRDVDRGLQQGEKGIKSLGDEADKTRGDLSRFMDRLGAEAKKAGREVDDGMDHAKRGMEDMKSEAGQSGKEAAASFSGGFDSVTDFMQETAANALAGFGAVGGALGIAAASGLGFLASKAQEAAENIKNARDALRELYKRPDTTGLDRTEAFFDFLNEVGVDLPGLSRVLQAAGISMADFIAAGRDGGPVLQEVQRKLRELGGSGLGLAGILGDDMASGAQAAFDGLSQYAQGSEQAREEVELMNPLLKEQEEKTRAAAAAQEDAAAAAERHAETIGGVTESLKGAAEESGALAEAIAEDGQVSIKAVTDALNAQTQAAVNHKKNLRVALEEGGQEFLDWISQQPAEVAQAYVNGSDKERAKLRAAAAANGVAIGEGTAAGIVSSRPTSVAAAAETHERVRRKLEGEPVVIPVTVGSATGVEAVRQEMQRRFGRIVVDVVPNVQFGAGRFIP